MFWNPGAILMMAVLVGVTGWVIRGLMVTRHRLDGGSSTGKVAELEDRIRKLETATTSLLVDITSMREKERFMAKLQATSGPRESVSPPAIIDSGISPMSTQSIPVIPRVRNS